MKRNDNFPLVVLILFLTITIALFAGTAYQHLMHGGPTSTPQPITITLQQAEPLYTSASGYESISLRAGSQVKITAYHSKDRNSMWLTETADECRGILTNSSLEIQVEQGYNAAGNYVLPLWQFYEECIGKRFEEFDGKYRRAVFVPQHPSHTKEVVVPMPFTLRDTEDWKAYEPQVKYVDGVATAVEYQRIRAGNALILRFLPFTNWLIEKPFVQQIISKPQFTKGDPLRTSEKRAIYYLSYVVRLAGLVLYLTLMGIIPVVLLSLLLCTPLLRFISNPAMRIILFTVGAVSTYLWWLITMMEGFGWWYAWLPALCGLGLNIALAILMIRCRCEKCKRIAYIRLIESTLQRQFTNIREQTEYTSSTTRTREKGQKKTITKCGDEIIDETTEDADIIRETTNNYKLTYELKYNVKEYHNKYRCPHCGHVAERDEQDRTLVSKKLVNRKQTGQTTDIYGAPKR